MSTKDVTLGYQGETYVLKDEWTGDEENVELVQYMWGVGNYRCDCNRGSFIRQQHDTAPVDLESMPCGDKIELVSHWAIKEQQ